MDISPAKGAVFQGAGKKDADHGHRDSAHHAAVAKVKKHKKDQRVQIKCPVGSPNSFVVPKKVAVNEECCARVTTAVEMAWAL